MFFNLIHIFTFYLHGTLHVFESWNAYLFFYHFHALLRQSLNLLGERLTNVQNKTNFTAPMFCDSEQERQVVSFRDKNRSPALR